MDRACPGPGWFIGCDLPLSGSCQGETQGLGAAFLQLYDQTPKVLQPDLSGALKHRWVQVEGETGLPWLH